MILRNHRFVNVEDQKILDRLLRSQDIRTINRFEFFEAVNNRNVHRYKVQLRGNEIVCTCPDSKIHTCKHEIAVARDIELFEGIGW